MTAHGGAGSESWVAFELGALACALPMRAVREVIRAPMLTEVPFTPSHVLGVVAAAGALVTVFELSACIGVERRPDDDRSRVVLLHGCGEPIGVRVCAILGVLQLDRSQRLSLEDGEAEGTPSRHWLAGRAEYPGTARGLWLLDETRLLL